MKIILILLTLIMTIKSYSQSFEFRSSILDKLDLDIKDFILLDIDGDGDEDIFTNSVLAYGSENEIKWYENINGELHLRYLNNLDLSHTRRRVSSGAKITFSNVNDSGLFDIYSSNIDSSSFLQYELYKFTQISPLTFRKNLFFTGSSDIDHIFKIADFNNDLLPDIVALENSKNDTYQTVVYMNSSSGFIRTELGSEHSSINLRFNRAGTIFTDIYIDDINSDSFDDILVIVNEPINSGPPPLPHDQFIIYFKSLGNGKFTKQKIGPLNNGPGAVGLVFNPGPLLNIYDKNNDGLKEIQYPNFGSDEVHNFYLQKFEDSFVQTSINIGNIPNSNSSDKILFKNQDNGTFQDVISIPYTNADFAIYHKNDGNDNYTATNIFRTEGNLKNAHLIDLHSDGLVDILVSESFKIQKYTQTNELMFNKSQISDAFLGKIKLIETFNFNNDSDKDLIVVSAFNSNIFVYLNEDSKNFKRTLIDDTDSKRIGIGVNDFNTDGFQDILSVSFVSHNEVDMFWYENMSGNDFTKHFISTIKADNVASDSVFIFKDLDNDGDLDLIQDDQPRLRWYENIGGNFASSQVIITNGANEFYDRNFIDFDLDGDMDITYSYKQCFLSCSGSTFWMELNNENQYIEHLLDENSYKVFKPGDINNDGIIDFVVKSEGGENLIWLGMGGSFQIIPIEGVFFKPILDLVDINNDGLLDIVQENKILFNLGNLKFKEQAIVISDNTKFKAKLITDINNDGLTDIISDLFGFNEGIRFIKQIHDLIFQNGFD